MAKTDEKLALTVEDTAEVLSVSPDTIRRKISKGELQHFRLSDTDKGHLRIPVTAIIAYIEKRVAQAAGEGLEV